MFTHEKLNEELNLNKVSRTLKDKIKSTCNENLDDSTRGLKVDVTPVEDGIQITITSKEMRVGILKAIRDTINNYYFGEGTDKSAIQDAKISCSNGTEEVPFLERPSYDEFNEGLKAQESMAIIKSPKITLKLHDPNKLRAQQQPAPTAAPTETPVQATESVPAKTEQAKITESLNKNKFFTFRG